MFLCCVRRGDFEKNGGLWRGRKGTTYIKNTPYFSSSLSHHQSAKNLDRETRFKMNVDAMLPEETLQDFFEILDFL